MQIISYVVRVFQGVTSLQQNWTKYLKWLDSNKKEICSRSTKIQNCRYIKPNISTGKFFQNISKELQLCSSMFKKEIKSQYFKGIEFCDTTNFEKIYMILSSGKYIWLLGLVIPLNVCLLTFDCHLITRLRVYGSRYNFITASEQKRKVRVIAITALL